MKVKDKKNEKNPQKNMVKEKVSELLELPREIILDVPKLLFIGNTHLSIENYKGIIEYTDHLIRINTTTHMLRITGEKLEIKTIMSEEIMVGGNIIGIEFVS